MESRHYHLWQRRWVRARSKSERLESHHERSNVTTEGVSLASLGDIPCLILLGAPGLGKSNEIQLEARNRIASGEASDIVSLGRLTGVNDLESLVLSKAKRSDLSGVRWNLFLDGLDEALSQFTQSHDAIPSVFRQLALIKDLGSVRLRLTCRSAEWPASLEADFKEIWGASGIQIYELQELSEQDIRLAASELSPERTDIFLSQIERREVEALAKRPVTLNMLLDVFEEHYELPVQRVQLYRQALLASIEVSNRQLREPQLDAFSQLMVAGRIAAASIFSNSTEISTALRPSPQPGRAIAISELVGGFEPASNGSFSVGEVELHQALLTSLFTPVSDGLFTWSHQTFAEFLSAYYLIERGLNSRSLLEYLRPSEGARIPPQLREVSAWLASMDTGFFSALAESEPDILLHSDVASASPEARESLVQELLLRFDQAELHDFDVYGRFRYERLGHPRLAEQLLPFVLGREKNIVARRVAIDIAEANGGAGLDNVLADVALETTENLHVRVQAAAAVSKVAGGKVRLRLRDLTHGNGLDENDELKGYALKALWPERMSVEELIASLTPEKTSNWIGSYALFVSTLELPKLTAPESQNVLRWISVATSDEERSRTFSRVIPRFLDRVWDNSNHPEVLRSLADFFLDLFSSAHYFVLLDLAKDFLVRVGQSGTRRISLVKEIVRYNRSENWSWLASPFPVSLVTIDDLPWLLERVVSPSDEFPEKASVQLILAVIAREDIDQLESVWKAYELAPDRVRRSISRVLLKSESEYDARHVTSLFDKCFDEKLGNLFWNALRKSTKEKVREALTSYLAKRGHSELTGFLLRELESDSNGLNQITQEREFVAGVSSLLQSRPASVWPSFARFRVKNESLALQIIRSFGFEDSAFISEMSEMDLADFFIWTYKTIPPATDDQKGRARWVGTDDQVDHLRHAALRKLTTLGTSLAVTAVKRIAAELPEAPWLKYQVLDARRAFDATTWRLREPSEVIAAIALYGSIQPPGSTKAALASVADASVVSFGTAQALNGTNSASLEETIDLPPGPPPVTPRKILAVATEWRSGHGGISTLNRELCVGLAKLGHEVACLVVNATSEEIRDAKGAHVHLVSPLSDPVPSLSDITRLLLFSRRRLEPFEPEIVIGHDHITGTAARHIARDTYNVPYVHFIHTLPEEIERHKTRGPQSVLTGAIKGQIQMDQCKGAQLVVAIGPKIFQQIVGRLTLTNVTVVEMRPGLNNALLKHVVYLSKPRRKPVF
jgi:hypothetical protein